MCIRDSVRRHTATPAGAPRHPRVLNRVRAGHVGAPPTRRRAHMTGAHTVEHAWMPRSPCGSGCVSPNVEPVGGLRYAARWTALLVIVFLSPLLILLRLLPTPMSAR